MLSFQEVFLWRHNTPVWWQLAGLSEQPNPWRLNSKSFNTFHLYFYKAGFKAIMRIMRLQLISLQLKATGNYLETGDCYGKTLRILLPPIFAQDTNLLFGHCKLENLVIAAVWTEEDQSHTTSTCQGQSCLNHILEDISPTGTWELLGVFLWRGSEEVKEREGAHPVHV